jgi:hypothetical protein
MFHALALAALLAAAPGEATPGAGSAKGTSIAAQVAREFLTPDLWERTLKGIIAQYAAQVRAAAQQSGGTVDAGLEATMRRLYDEIIPYGEVVELQASLLQKHFTNSELVKLRDFYRSPLGVKMRDRMPEIQQEALARVLQKVDMERIGEALRPHFHMPSKGDDPGAAPEKPQPSGAE